jgi:hypothetical protein
MDHDAVLAHPIGQVFGHLADPARPGTRMHIRQASPAQPFAVNPLATPTERTISHDRHA